LLRAKAGGVITIVDTIATAIAAVARMGCILIARLPCRSTRDVVRQPAPVVNINLSNSAGLG
jgi:hypothetical protein